VHATNRFAQPRCQSDGPAAHPRHDAARTRLLPAAGRVTSLSQLRHAAAIGCGSTDGTHLVFGPAASCPNRCPGFDQVDQPGDIPPAGGSLPAPDCATASARQRVAVTAESRRLARVGSCPHHLTSWKDRLAMPMPEHDLHPHASDQPADDTTWTAERIRALGLHTDIATAARIFGLSRATAYDLAKRDQFPVSVLRFGTRYCVPVAAILQALHLPAGDAQPPDPTPPPAT
jgi:hypothetical protein